MENASLVLYRSIIVHATICNLVKPPQLVLTRPPDHTSCTRPCLLFASIEPIDNFEWIKFVSVNTVQCKTIWFRDRKYLI